MEVSHSVHAQPVETAAHRTASPHSASNGSMPELFPMGSDRMSMSSSLHSLAESSSSSSLTTMLRSASSGALRGLVERGKPTRNGVPGTKPASGGGKPGTVSLEYYRRLHTPERFAQLKSELTRGEPGSRHEGGN